MANPYSTNETVKVVCMTATREVLPSWVETQNTVILVSQLLILILLFSVFRSKRSKGLTGWRKLVE